MTKLIHEKVKPRSRLADQTKQIMFKRNLKVKDTNLPATITQFTGNWQPAIKGNLLRFSMNPTTNHEIFCENILKCFWICFSEPHFEAVVHNPLSLIYKKKKIALPTLFHHSSPIILPSITISLRNQFPHPFFRILCR